MIIFEVFLTITYSVLVLVLELWYVERFVLRLLVVCYSIQMSNLGS